MQCSKRIPNGTIIGTIPLEAAKAFPTQYFIERNLPVKIAYADAVTKGEVNNLIIKYLPDGSKRTPHPQVVLYVRGSYHLEELSYKNSDPANWTTWMETHIEAHEFQKIINSICKVEELLQ